MLKGIIFDMDGTLVDNIPFHKKAWLTLLGNNGIHMDPETFLGQNNGTIDEMIRKFFGNDLPAEKLKELGQEKESLYRNLYAEAIREIDGLSGFLKTLSRQGIKTGLATMGDPLNIDFILDRLNIRRFFSVITGGHEIQNGKPDPEIFLTTLQKLNEKAEDCLVIEDSISGVISATDAGLKVIGISTTEPAEELFEAGCYRVIPDYRETHII